MTDQLDTSLNTAVDLVRRAREVPDRVGVIHADGRRLTYGEWNDASERAATVLLEAGVARHDRVGLYLQNDLDLAVLLFACWRIGAVPVTLSVMYNAAELAGALDKTEPVALVAHRGKLDVVLEAERQCTASTEWSTRLFAAPDPSSATPAEHLATDRARDLATAIETAAPTTDLTEPGEDDDGTILFTGGTTGLPKAVIMTHRGTRDALTVLATASKGGKPGPYPAAPEGVTPNLLALPLFHSGGQQALLFALHVGRSIVLMERFDADTLGRLVAEHSIDNLFLMPTMLYDIVHAKPAPALASVRSVLTAGQALDPGLKREFEERWEIPVLSNYGSTELGHVAGWTGSDIRAGKWKPGSAGRIYDGVEVEIRDTDGRALPPGEAGEVCVRRGATGGYVGETGDGAEALVVDGWVRSGDVGYLDDDGVLFLVGRQRDMIKTGGFQVWPAEIEEVLRQHEAVSDVAVVGAPDVRLGEIPMAFIVLSDEAADAGTDHDRLTTELIDWCRSRLAHFKAIRSVAVVDALPRSEAGKVQRGALLERV